MSCQITAAVVAGEVVIGLKGRFCFLEFALRDRIQELLKDGHREFALDLSGLSYLDSFGLAQLICIRNLIQKAGGNMKLLRPSLQVQKHLRITNLDAVFSIVNDEKPGSLGAAQMWEQKVG